MGYKFLLRDLILVSLSSLVLVVSFPDANFGFLVWIGLVPLLIALQGRNIWSAFVLSQFAGMLFFLGIFGWILVVPGYSLLHHSILALHLGSYFGLFGLGFSFISKRWGFLWALLASPLLWVGLEFIRSNLSFLALPWGLLAHSQFQYPVVIQMASVTGAYGVSFLIVLVNSNIAALLMKIGGGKLAMLRKMNCRGSLSTGCLPFIAFGILSVAIVLSFGFYTVPKGIEGRRVNIGMVQGNVEQFKKWDPQFAREIRKIYLDLTREVSRHEPRLVIWPETATPGSITADPIFYKQLVGMTQETGVPILLGSAQNQKLAGQKEKDAGFYNSAFLIGSRDGPRTQRYDKIRLFPFGEYTPYEKIIPWNRIGVPVRGSYRPGAEYRIFEHPEFRFGVTICWENVFSELVREFIKRGAQCIINLTNEAHFGDTAAPHQLVAISVFRAVENRIFVVRSANTGVSCIIDPYGRIVDRVKDEEGRDTFIRGTLTSFVIPMESNTFFTRHGNVLPWVCVFGSVGFLLTVTIKRRRYDGHE
jgi:apolipoprotein N-acyltransferase